MEEIDPLDPDGKDALAATARAIAGIVPWMGTAIGEFLTHQIREQRIDRVATYVRALEGRIKDLELEQNQLLEQAEKADLIEEGAVVAARSSNKRRIEQIAELVVQGLDRTEVEAIRQRRLLALFEELDDEEVMLLHAIGLASHGDGSGWQKLDRPNQPTMGSGQSGIKPFYLFEAGRNQLLRLGLVAEVRAASGSGKPRTAITNLGKVLLDEIGLPANMKIDASEK